MDWNTLIGGGLLLLAGGLTTLALRRQPIFVDISETLGRVLKTLFIAQIGFLVGSTWLTSRLGKSEAGKSIPPEYRIAALDLISETTDLALQFLIGTLVAIVFLTILEFLFAKQADYESKPADKPDQES